MIVVTKKRKHQLSQNKIFCHSECLYFAHCCYKVTYYYYYHMFGISTFHTIFTFSRCKILSAFPCYLLFQAISISNKSRLLHIFHVKNITMVIPMVFMFIIRFWTSVKRQGRYICNFLSLYYLTTKYQKIFSKSLRFTFNEAHKTCSRCFN